MINYDGHNVHTEVTLKCNREGADSTILDNAVACGTGETEEEHVLERVRLSETIFGTSPKFIYCCFIRRCQQLEISVL